MKESFDTSPVSLRHQRGSAGLKFLLVLAVVVVVGYMGFQYIPVAFQARSFKTFMNDKVTFTADNPAIPTEQKGAAVENQLRSNAKEYGVPPDAKISHVYQNGGLQVTVQFTRPINLLPGFTYQYKFDYTAKSNNSLNTPSQ